MSTENRNIFEKEIQTTLSDEDVVYLKKGKKIWKNIALSFEITGKALVALSGVTSFVATYLDDKYISLSAGIISSLSFAILYFSNFGYSEANRRIIELNSLIDAIPDKPKIKEEQVKLLIDDTIDRVRDKIKDRIYEKEFEEFVSNADEETLEEFNSIAEKTSAAIEKERAYILKHNFEL